jgi:FAD/FMN-containing dehydrogenase
MAGDDADRVKENYGGNYERLARVKADWDPENLFRMNQNIPPSRKSETTHRRMK